MPTANLMIGDCVDTMNTMEPESVHAVVCDPPYGLEFMGLDWDRLGAHIRDLSDADPLRIVYSNGRVSGLFAARGQKVAYGQSAASMQGWHQEWAAAAHRVLKPGGHLLAFGGSRTFHRLAAGIEDAGFTIRDTLAWLYGSGFPKSHNVGRSVAKIVGADPANEHGLTDSQCRWEGWGTALKPAFEPIVLARKPCGGTVAEAVRVHGTGALNIDGCRIPIDKPLALPREGGSNGSDWMGEPLSNELARALLTRTNALGRWPANVLLDTDAAAMLDDQTAHLVGATSATRRPGTIPWVPNAERSDTDTERLSVYGDDGGASRFFYCAKASTSERDAGITHDGGNLHPTVKPIELMRWLIRLVTPPYGTVLDPFLGSGSTGIAAYLEGKPFVGIERDERYMRFAQHRIDWWHEHAAVGSSSVPPNERAALRAAGQMSLFDG